MRSLLRSCIAGYILFLCMPVKADIYSFARKFTMDHLELEVQVTDTSDKPLAGAVLWYLDRPVRPEKGLNMDVATMQRMAHRYANLSDFLDTSDIPGTVFERTDMQGYYRNYRETKGNGPYTYILVATKRGYLPEVIAGSTPYDVHHLVRFKLKPDADANIDPRMEAFDHIMAQARNVEPGESSMSESRMIKLRDLEKKARALATSLERDGLHDEASAVYWALADFPQVILVESADGKQQIAGYRNGRVDPQAEADRMHATRLNSGVPKLLVPKMVVEQGFSRTRILTEAHGQAYLAAFETILASPIKEQVLPVDYHVAIYQAVRWSTPAKACELLQRAYQFEPATMPLNDWKARLKDVQMQRKKLQLPPQDCHLGDQISG